MERSIISSISASKKGRRKEFPSVRRGGHGAGGCDQIIDGLSLSILISPHLHHQLDAYNRDDRPSRDSVVSLENQLVLRSLGNYNRSLYLFLGSSFLRSMLIIIIITIWANAWLICFRPPHQLKLWWLGVNQSPEKTWLTRYVGDGRRWSIGEDRSDREGVE